MQTFSKVSVNVAAETAVGIGPFSDTIFTVTLEDGMIFLSICIKSIAPHMVICTLNVHGMKVNYAENNNKTDQLITLIYVHAFSTTTSKRA